MGGGRDLVSSQQDGLSLSLALNSKEDLQFGKAIL